MFSFHGIASQHAVPELKPSSSIKCYPCPRIEVSPMSPVWTLTHVCTEGSDPENDTGNRIARNRSVSRRGEVRRGKPNLVSTHNPETRRLRGASDRQVAGVVADNETADERVVLKLALLLLSNWLRSELLRFVRDSAHSGRSRSAAPFVAISHEFLDSFPGIHFASVNVSFAIDAHLMQPVKVASHAAAPPETP